jgi:hypothetical protein
VAKAKRGAEAADAYTAILGLGSSSEYDIYPDSALMDADFGEDQADRGEERERERGGKGGKGGVGAERKRKRVPETEPKSK